MTLRFTPKATPARPYLLTGKRVGLAEAARILDVGLATVARHIHAGVIDVAAISALAPIEPLKKAITPLKPVKPKRYPRTYAFGERTLTLREWSDLVGLPLDLLRQRIEVNGWDIGRALSRPVRRPIPVRNRIIIHRIASTFHEVAA